MKVKELIEVLNQQDPELTVALVCDHGQETMKLTMLEKVELLAQKNT